MPSEPHLMARRESQTALQHEVLPPRDRQPRFERQLAGKVPAHRHPLDGADQAEANPRLRAYQTGIVLSESTAELRERRIDDVVHGDAAVPDGLLQLLTRDHFARVAQQGSENLQGPTLNLDDLPVHAQLDTHFVEFGGPKAIPVLSGALRMRLRCHFDLPPPLVSLCF
ncbi:MAG TPA: hypothetical protein VFN79_04110 [Steroidobacteraceae bacterium]|nr:hypothetical protein [Steroidobacteraceae bacterium]